MTAAAIFVVLSGLATLISLIVVFTQNSDPNVSENAREKTVTTSTPTIEMTQDKQIQPEWIHFPTPVCAVFVCNQRYLPSFVKTCSQLIEIGKYTGDICLIIGQDLKDTIYEDPFIQNNYIRIQYFPEIQFSDEFIESITHLNRKPSWNEKLFQFHKFYLFHTFFKQWNYVLYMDCGVSILDDVAPVVAAKEPNTLLAHSDAYPTFEWKMGCQFDETQTKYFDMLSSTFDLNRDYFQSTFMLFDTNIIKDSTFSDIVNLAEKYPISKTNDQGILCLYFIYIEPVWKQLPIKDAESNRYLYDYLRRDPDYQYVMLKRDQ